MKQSKKPLKKSIEEIMELAHGGDLQRLKKFFPADVNVKDKCGSTMLIWACYSNRFAVAAFVLEKGADPDIKSKDELTALCICANNNYLQLVRLLAPKTTDHNGPLRSAALSGNLDIVKYLLNFNSKDEKVKAKATDVNGALRLAASKDHVHVVGYLMRQIGPMDTMLLNSAVHAAVVNGSLKATKLLLAELKDPFNASICECHRNVLHLAAANNKLELVIYALQQGADINSVSEEGNTALHVAAAARKNDMVNFLIAKGADVDAKKSNGCTALQSACATGNTELVKVLFDAKANVSSLDNQGCTPLHSAAFGGFLDIVKLMVEKLGADPTTRSNDLSTVMHAAVANDALSVIRYLSTMVDANPKDDEGHSPARLAVTQGHMESLKCLLEECKANVQIADDQGWTLLHVAVTKNQPDFVKYLLSQGACPNAKDTFGNTALYYAAHDDRTECAECLVDVTTVSEVDGISPLHIAASRGNIATVRAIVRPSVINYKTDFGFTAVCVAAMNGHVDVVKELAMHGADLELGTNNNYTALHLASEAGHYKVVKNLVRKWHVKVEAKTNQGCTALMCATQNGHIKVLKWLVRNADAAPRLDSKCGTAIDLAKIAAEKKPEMWEAVDWLSRRCSSCGRWGRKLCNGCEEVYYCDAKCQQKNWAVHKARCKT